MPATPPHGSTTGSPHHDAGGPSPQPDRPSPQPETSPLWRQRSLWIGVAAAVAAVAIAYGVGRAQGAMALRGAEEKHAGARATWESALAACEADRDLLTARRSLSLVALSLERRNFGVAESHRHDALRALDKPTLRGIAAASEVGATIKNLDIGVDPNPGTKRDQVIAAAESLDGVLASRQRRASAPPASSAATAP